jgi:hypothetical protein
MAHLPPRQWGATWHRQARGGADHRHRLRCLVIPVGQETYGFLSLTMPFIPSMIWLELILLLQYFILNYIMSMFRSIRFLYTIIVMVMIYFQIILKLKFLFIPSIQKPYYKNFNFMAGFVDALRPEKFSGEHFKRWQTIVILWLFTMNVLWVSKGKPVGPLTPTQEKAFTEVKRPPIREDLKV